MRNKTSILVGIRYFLYALLVAVIFCGCETRDRKYNLKGQFIDYKVIVVDSCEYIFYETFNSNGEITHKGNCRFCAERSKK